MNNITMNSKTNITITLTRKEAECLRDMAEYHVEDEIGDGAREWRERMGWDEDKEEKEMIKYGNRALDKIEAALRCEPASTN
jgi:hypothetical protein